jgi:hypothetical protein
MPKIRESSKPDIFEVATTQTRRRKKLDMFQSRIRNHQQRLHAVHLLRKNEHGLPEYQTSMMNIPQQTKYPNIPEWPERYA